MRTTHGRRAQWHHAYRTARPERDRTRTQRRRILVNEHMKEFGTDLSATLYYRINK